MLTLWTSRCFKEDVPLCHASLFWNRCETNVGVVKGETILFYILINTDCFFGLIIVAQKMEVLDKLF